MKLNTVIGYDYRKGIYVIGEKDLKGNEVKASIYNQADVDSFLAGFATARAAGEIGFRQAHEMLGQTIMEPIEQVVPYKELYGPIFFQDWPIASTEDNAIPVEDTVSTAWETHQNGEVMFVASGYSWTRPGFVTYDTGIEVKWEALRKAGWNFLARQMQRATEDLARKRDVLAKAALDAAVLPSHGYNVTGGKLTKAAVDAILKDQAAIGFPVQRVLINPSTLMDMAAFTWGGTGFFIAPEEAREILRTLHIMNYGGAEWYSNPFALTTTVYFGGAPNQIGWRQIKGTPQTASDVDIIRKRDLHVILDSEWAHYVGNAYTLAKLTIGP